MKWGSSLSEERRLEPAVRAAAAGVRGALAPDAASLVIVFVAEHPHGDHELLPELLAREFPGALVVGCSAGGVIGGGREVEHRPAVSLTAAALPGVALHPFHLESGDLPADDEPQASWEKTFGASALATPHFLVFPDPLTFDADRCLRGLDLHFPESTKLGGLASGGGRGGGNDLFLGGAIHRSGAVGVALSGDLSVDTIVAQGCRPIGDPMFVTRARENLLLDLDGQPARQVVQALYATLPAADQSLFRQSLLLGVVMRERQSEYRAGDFLIRNLLGVEQQTGALVTGALLTTNQVVQFHLRDAQTSADDLEGLLARYRGGKDDPHPSGSLLFSCLGRGEHLYGRPDHDSDLFRRHLGEVPLGGFFCNGEIGQVQGQTFVHGYTSSFGLFRPRSA
jgi:small ligand-binding sensory domain FIST